MSFQCFSEIALYHPQHGYYTSDRHRVGRDPQSDFYTASSLGPVFACLVTEAARNLLPPGMSPGDLPWLEIAPEPAGSPFEDAARHGFADYQAYPLGKPLEIPPAAVIFANEWLDACPFRRFQYLGGEWRELGVKIMDDRLEPCVLDSPAEESHGLLTALEAEGPHPEGYCVDLSLAAEIELEKLVRQSWRGLLLLADYGKSWQELVTACPAGTASAYFRHQSSRDLTARPGRQDLTCHVCWDRLLAVLHRHGFECVELCSQERFFMRHAATAIASIIQRQPEKFDPQRQTLAQILHPAHMGHAFQILAARRK